MATSSVLRRALLYVPSTSQKMLTKSLLLTPDTLCYDLEDSVAAHLKAPARTALAAFLSSPPFTSAFPTYPAPAAPRRPEIALRINAPSTPHALADLTTLLAHSGASIDTLVVPKVDSAADLHFITDVLRQLLPARHPASPTTSPPPPGTKPPIAILALIESARAITNLSSICTASPYLSGLIFAAEDFALSLSATRTPSLQEFLFARQAIVTYAAAHALPSTIDLVHVGFSRGNSADATNPAMASLRDECARGREMGFNGKQCIHPSQVACVQAAFSPSAAELQWAVRVVVADAKAAKAGRGAWTLEGKMVDVPVVRRAQAVVDRAVRCGMDVEGVRMEWAGQEAE